MPLPDDVRVLSVRDETDAQRGAPADPQAADRAVRAARELLEHSPRFGVGADADAVVALTALGADVQRRADTTVETDTNEQGREVKHTVFRASQDVTLQVAWRVYEPDGRMLDEHEDTWASTEVTGEGASRDEVLGALPGPDPQVRALAGAAGEAYARRIAPAWVEVRRPYYGHGAPELRDGVLRVRAADWKGAIRLWTQLAGSSSGRLRAKANHNLAVAWEMRGNLVKAMGYARDAEALWSTGRTRAYVDLLRERQASRKRVRAQMEPIRSERRDAAEEAE